MTWNGRLSFVEFDARSACETVASLHVEAAAADTRCQAERARLLRAVAAGIERKPRPVPPMPDHRPVSSIHAAPEPTDAGRPRWTRLTRRASALRAVAQKNPRASVTHPGGRTLRLVSSDSASPNPAPAAFR
jgi:hypothetical protein